MTTHTSRYGYQVCKHTTEAVARTATHRVSDVHRPLAGSRSPCATRIEVTRGDGKPECVWVWVCRCLLSYIWRMAGLCSLPGALHCFN